MDFYWKKRRINAAFFQKSPSESSTHEILFLWSHYPSWLKFKSVNRVKFAGFVLSMEISEGYHLSVDYKVGFWADFWRCEANHITCIKFFKTSESQKTRRKLFSTFKGIFPEVFHVNACSEGRRGGVSEKGYFYGAVAVPTITSHWGWASLLTTKK